MLKNLPVIMLGSLLAAGSLQGDDAPKAESKAPTITGRCHCGKITYQISGPIITSNHCDCQGCRRATGTMKAPFVGVKKAHFTVTAGTPSVFKSASGVKCDAHGIWNFCPTCGTQLFWQPHKGDQLDIFAGTLDDPTLFKPKK